MFRVVLPKRRLADGVRRDFEVYFFCLYEPCAHWGL